MIICMGEQHLTSHTTGFPKLESPRVLTSYCLCRRLGFLTIVITHMKGLITPLITTHEPPSKMPLGFKVFKA